MVTRILARWAPQELPTGGVSPGQNRFPFDPTFFPTDNFTGPGYVWHCHMLGHEDHDMMRPHADGQHLGAGVSYPVGRVVAHQNINYRVRVAHTSQSSQPPNTRFDLWERVNNNDGTLAAADHLRGRRPGAAQRAALPARCRCTRRRPGQTPPANPALWEPLPMTACGQLAKFCADDAGQPGRRRRAWRSDRPATRPPAWARRRRG